MCGILSTAGVKARIMYGKTINGHGKIMEFQELKRV